MTKEKKYQEKNEIASFLKIERRYITFQEEGNLFVITGGDEKIEIREFHPVIKKYQLVFKNCIFDCYIGLVEQLDKDIKFYPFFHNCIFKKNISFWDKPCITKFIFTSCVFESEIKMATDFHEDVVFRECFFKDHVTFDRCNFEKNVNLYGSIFTKCPNFSQSSFKGSLNLVNVKLDFDYEELIQEINLTWEQKNKNGDQYTKEFIANDFRDSFRLFKNTLAKEGNNLDASNHHRVELYCKEIELNFKKPRVFSRDWIDKIQLTFYRLISDHHTDLGKILGNVILLIALFGIFSLLLDGIKTAIPIEEGVAIQTHSDKAIQNWHWGIFQNLVLDTRTMGFSLCFLFGIFLFSHIVECIFFHKSWRNDGGIKKFLF